MSLISDFRFPSYRSEFNDYTKSPDKLSGKEEIRSILENFNCDIQNSAHITDMIEIVESNEIAGEMFIDDNFQPFFQEKEEVYQKCLGDEDYEILPKSFDYKFLPGPYNIYKIPLNKLGALSPTLSSALRLLPSLLPLRLFYQSNPNPKHIFSVFLFHFGRWNLIIFDSFFPFSTQKQIFTSLNETKTIFPMLLEKAAAKLFGEYSFLKKMNVKDWIRVLTGCPIEEKKLDSLLPIQDLNQLKERNPDQDYPSDSNFNEIGNRRLESPERNGTTEVENKLAGLNEYVERGFVVILEGDSIASLKGIEKKGNQYIFMLTKCGKGGNENFIASLEEVRNRYEKIVICKIHENYFYGSISIKNLDHNTHLIKLELKEHAHVYLQFFIQLKLNSNFFIRVLAYNKKKGNFNFISGKYTDKEYFYIEEYFDLGSNFILIETLGKFSISSLIISSFTSTKDLSFEDVGTNEIELLEIQKKIIQNIARRNLYETQKIRSNQDIKIYNDIIFGILYFSYENNSQKQKLVEKITMTKLENMFICPPFTDNKEFQIALNPGEQTIVLYKYEPIQAYNYSYKSNINIQLEEVKASQPNFMNLEEFYKSNDIFFSEIAVQVDNDKRTRIIQLVKEQGKRAQRIWEDKKIDVFIYTYTHCEGVVFLYINNSYFPYEENLSFELQNLEIQNNINKQEFLKIQLEAFSEYLIFLRKRKRESNFSYKALSNYKYYI